MNIHEASRRFNVSLRKLRAMEAAKVFPLDAEDGESDAIRFHLARNQALTVAHILTLLDAPELLDELGRYRSRAVAQLATLGDVKATSAPRDVTAYVDEAARGDADAARIIAEWLKGALPAHDVPHAWIAARLLWPLQAGLRDKSAKGISLALMRAREHMGGFFHKDGKTTVYHQFRLTELNL